MSLEKLYTLEEVAEYLNVSTATVYRYIKDNKLQSVKKLGKKRVTETNLNKFVNE